MSEARHETARAPDPGEQFLEDAELVRGTMRSLLLDFGEHEDFLEASAAVAQVLLNTSAAIKDHHQEAEDRALGRALMREDRARATAMFEAQMAAMPPPVRESGQGVS